MKTETKIDGFGLLPASKRKESRIACYDNGGKTVDRYTVVYLGFSTRGLNTYQAVGMNSEPFHPQGFGQHTVAMRGAHLGRRIAFTSLPADCQKLVRLDLEGHEPIDTFKKTGWKFNGIGYPVFEVTK